MSLRDRLEAIRQRAQSSPTGRLLLRLGIGVLGTLVVIIGIILIPFPGPGWLIVFFGLAILSIEFTWARRLLHFARTHVERWWHWLGRQNLVVRALAGVAGLAVVAGVLVATLWFSFGVTPGDVRRYIAG